MPTEYPKIPLADLGANSTQMIVEAALATWAMDVGGEAEDFERKPALDALSRVPWVDDAERKLDDALRWARVEYERLAEPDPVPAQSQRPRWITAAELAHETPAEVPWVAPPIAASGVVTFMGGPPKLAGKTTLVMHLVAAVLRGLPWLGAPTRRGAVVYLTEEASTTFRMTLQRAGLLESKDLHLLMRRTVTGAWADTMSEARAKVRETGAVLLVVDTYAEWTGLRGDQENDAGHATAALAPIKAAAADGIAVVVIGHVRKNGGDIVDAIRGSSAVAGSVDLIIGVAPGGEARVRKLTFASRLDVPQDLVVELTPSGYVSRGTAAEAATADAAVDARTDVERVIAAVPIGLAHAITLADLTLLAADGVSGRAWKRAIDSALADGRIQRDGAGRRESPHKFWREDSPTDDATGEGALR